MEEFISPFKGLAFSVSQKEIGIAIMRFQSLCPPVRKTGRAHHGKYVELDTLVATIRPALAKQGLHFTQHVTNGSLVTLISHNSGEWIASEMQMDKPQIPKANDAQKAGGAITYARRYALAAALGLVVDEDNDGIEAAGGMAGMGAKQTPSPRKLSKEHIAAKNDLLDLVQGTEKEEGTAKWLESNPSLSKIQQLIKKLQ